MEKWDEIGEYSYTPDFCIRDAFRQFLGDSALLRWFPENCSVERVKKFCRHYGYEYCFHDGSGRSWSRDFRIGQAVIWFLVEPPDFNPEGHASFCRDARRALEFCEATGCILVGYVALER